MANFSASFSPDGRRVWFSRDQLENGVNHNGIFETRADGTKLRHVTVAADNPDWSPDGRQLAYGMSDEGHCDLFRLGLRPPVAGAVIHDQDGCNVNPSWSRSPWREDD